MLLVIEVEKLETEEFMNMDEGKKVTVTGKARNIFFRDNYLEEIEEKAKLFDEYSLNDEKILSKESEANNPFLEKGYIGHDTKARESL